MASDLIVPVVEVMNVREHPDADSLELLDVLGYQLCVKKGAWVDGMRGIYFPPDTVLPPEWGDTFGVRNYLRGKNKDRVGQARLRGEFSFGLLVDLPDESWVVGQNVAEHYGATKYEPPIKPLQGDMAAYDNNIDPLFTKYTDIQNGRIYFTKFRPEEEVVVTEKIHGSNGRLGLINGQMVAGSHTTRRKRPDSEDREDWKRSTYWFPWSLSGVNRMLEHLKCEDHKVIIVFGEIYGGSVQSLNYGIEKGRGFGFRLFDIYVDGDYLDWPIVTNLANQFSVETAPVIYCGPFNVAKINALADGKTTMPGANHIREGVVVKPVKERRDPALGRVIGKWIGNDYMLSKHKKKDTTDV